MPGPDYNREEARRQMPYRVFECYPSRSRHLVGGYSKRAAAERHAERVVEKVRRRHARRDDRHCPTPSATTKVTVVDCNGITVLSLPVAR